MGSSQPCLHPAPSRALELCGTGALLFGGCSPGRSRKMLFPPSPGAVGERGGEEGCPCSSSSLQEGKKPQGLAAAGNHPELLPAVSGGAPGWAPISAPGAAPGSPGPSEQRRNFSVPEGTRGAPPAPLVNLHGRRIQGRFAQPKIPFAADPGKSPLRRELPSIPAVRGERGCAGVPSARGSAGSALGVLILPG